MNASPADSTDPQAISPGPTVDSEITWLLHRAAQRMRTATGAQAEQHDIQLRDHLVLSALHQTPNLTQIELGKALGLDKTTLMSQLDRLEDAEIIHRHRDPRDRRARIPQITPKEMIVDNTCMQLVSRPQQFEMLATGNLYGDLLSDLGAGLSGGLASTAGIMHADGVRVYESIFGASHELVGVDRANPLPLILPALEMLRDLGELEVSTRISRAIEKVLTDRRVLTSDLGGSASTRQFTDAIIHAMG